MLYKIMHSKISFAVIIFIKTMIIIRFVYAEKCIDGFYGKGCKEPCPDLCVACNRREVCTQCKLGYYNGYTDENKIKYTHICEVRCARNCLTCENHYTECTSCADGYYTGYKYSNPQNYKRKKCLYKCMSNCKTCVSKENCTQCKDGYFGQKCERNCPKYCTKCDKILGDCTTHCQKPNLRGLYCNITCSNCKNNNCTFNGTCSDGCRVGLYGSSCKKTCPHNCLKDCDKEGKCNHCKDGYFGDTCNQTCPDRCMKPGCKQNGRCKECENGFYGPYCGETCSIQCLGRICNKTNGICLETNQDWVSTDNVITEERYVTKEGSHAYKSTQAGKKRQTEEVTPTEVNSSTADDGMTETDRTDLSFLIVIASCAAGAVVVIVFILTLSVIIKRRRTTKLKSKHSQRKQINGNENVIIILDAHEEQKDQGMAFQICDEALDAIPIELNNDRNTYYNTGIIRRKIAVTDLPMFIQNKADVLKDFQLLPPDLIKPYADSQKGDNIHRNRYRMVYPYDFNRVKLNGMESDYINASHVDGYSRQKAYIAALGPTAKTTEDFKTFWHMVWQENIENIVMLTNLVEAGGPKCDMYWPRNDSNEIYGDIIVTCLQEDIFVDYTLRKFELKKKSSVRAVHHFHYMVWPDKGVPSDLSSIIDLRQRVLRSQSNLSGPILVHCSAGVGRTGTYIALDILIEQGQHENGVEIFSCVRNLREQRVNMVQTVEQYQYIHDAVAYALFVDCKPIPEDRLKDLIDCSSIEDIGSIYENMQKMNDQKSKMEMDAVARNEMMSQQNREGADIPGDENRPRLYMNIIPGSSDYINAVYINGLKARNRYIVAQTPLQTTLEYFLTLIVQENCSVIVDMDNSQDQTCGRYLPEDGESIQVGSFSVSVSALQTSEQFSSCKMILSHKSCTPAENRELHLYRYRGWNDNSSVPESPTRFNGFIKDVESKLTEDNSMLVHCRTGAVRCGILCAVAVILQKLDIDGEVSIPNVVKQIKTRRSLAIPNKEQFVFCYECATEYIRYLTHTYANFVERA